jgi:signal transduction histidine kinase
LGTGRGINQLSFSSGNAVISPFAKTGSECNQNAILQDDKGDIWIGTTKGAIKCNPLSKNSSYPPRIVLNTAKLFYKEKEDTLFPGAKLRYDQNHLTFEFRGISLSDPEKILYRYKLEGSDNAYSAPSKSPFVVYPALPPGKYVFKVRAVSADHVESENTAEFAFEIAAPYYSTGVFRGSLVLMFILTGVSLQAYRTRIKEREKQKIEMLRIEEQQKIRQKTSEDFHDEMGNKLTRITVLSDILETQLNRDQEDQKKLIVQIKDNVSALYTGTKDILWSLQPESDNLYEILKRIKDFGMELFQETSINFTVTGLNEEYNMVTLPIDYSRNILMIFKESLNNALKHAECKNVSIHIEKNGEDELKIVLRDDGRGFDTHTVKKGNGIGNIQIRAKRINGTMQVISGKNEGTMLVLQIKIPPTV